LSISTDTIEQKSRRLLELYQPAFRDFLASNGVIGANLDSLDPQAYLLEGALGRSTQVHIGFVGESQVGKSTLINAVLDRAALPHGGVGPLTARATRVTWGAEDRLVVAYHSRAQLNKLRFSLAVYLERKGSLPKGSAGEPPADAEDAAEFVALADPDVPEEGVDPGVVKAMREKGEYMLTQARRMLGAEKPGAATDAVVLDGIRSVLGQTLSGSADGLVPFLHSINDLSSRLGTTEELTASTLGGVREFNSELKARAAGRLSPLVGELHLELHSPYLESLSLVDLPGIGIVGDPAAKEAQRFVEAEGDALVLVFRNSGLSEIVADTLERAGIITKLLFGGRDGVAPVHVILAVTHLDDVARARYAELIQEANENGDPVPDRNRLFVDLTDEMETTLRHQVGVALSHSRAFEDLEGGLRASREAVVNRLVETMDIVCVSALDYVQERAQPGSGLAFITDLSTTGIPRLRGALSRLARRAGASRRKDIGHYSRGLKNALEAHLATMDHQYEEGRGVATGEFEHFRRELTGTATGLRQEMAALHGEVLGKLRGGLLESIRTLCGEAEKQGMKKLSRLSRQGRDLHYMSLKAALTRGGVWSTRSINYPEDLTGVVLDVIATQWEPDIIEVVRAEIRTMVSRDLTLVERLVKAATILNAKIVSEAPIDAQKKILQANGRAAVNWTKEHLEELRKDVQVRLRAVISPPIEKACRTARAAGRDRGSGAKSRILDVFEEGGSEALVEARKKAQEVLSGRYRLMLKKLEDGFLKEHHDPVQAAFDTLTGEQGRRAKRRDSQGGARILEQIELFRAELVELVPENAAEDDALEPSRS
jgi:hypothetical protein